MIASTVSIGAIGPLPPHILHALGAVVVEDHLGDERVLPDRQVPPICWMRFGVVNEFGDALALAVLGAERNPVKTFPVSVDAVMVVGVENGLLGEREQVNDVTDRRAPELLCEVWHMPHRGKQDLVDGHVLGGAQHGIDPSRFNRQPAESSTLPTAVEVTPHLAAAP